MLRTIFPIVAASLALLTGVLGAQSPEWRPNQPASTLTIDAFAGPSNGPIHAVRCVGELITLDYQSVNTGLGWELGMTLVPGLPASLSGACQRRRPDRQPCPRGPVARDALRHFL